jgi:hypothetical protein
MNKFEQILRKNIQAVTLNTVQPQPDQAERFPASKYPCSAKPGRSPDVKTICDAVKQLSGTVSGTVNDPGNNDCAKLIKSRNNTACTDRAYTTADTVIRTCDDYANGVVSAMPNNATNAQKAEAKRKAKCDCLNLALVGRPVLTSVTLPAGVMKQQIVDFYMYECSYTYLSKVCAERSKVSDALNAISPACPVPP